MSNDYLTLILRKIGIENIRNILPKIVFIVLDAVVVNGLSQEIYIRKMDGNMANVVDVRRRYAVYVMVNGTAPRNVQKTRKRIDFLKLRSRQVGNDAITVEPWLS